MTMMGGFAHVVVCKEDPTLVRKMMHKTGKHMAEHEVSLLKQLHHPNLIQVCGDVESSGDVVHFLLQNGGRDLVDTKIPKERARDVYEQIRDATAFMHSRNVVHMDLKMENAVVDSNWHVRVIDLGLAMHVPETHRGTRFCRRAAGSPSYLAPEVWDKERTYDPFPVDVWALGIILLAILYEILPWDTTAEGVDKQYTKWKRRVRFCNDTPMNAVVFLFRTHISLSDAPEWAIEEVNETLHLVPKLRKCLTVPSTVCFM